MTAEAWTASAPGGNVPIVGDAATRVLIIACGALAREVLAVIEQHGLKHVDLQCLPAQLHNRPQKIPSALRNAIHAAKQSYGKILIGYGDCGTGGQIDRLIEEEGVERIAGAHCYAFFTGLEAFDEEAERELGTFYLTDFLARHFETLVIRPLGLDSNPELRDLYFEHYTRLLYIAQTEDAELEDRARLAASRLGLRFEKRFTGYGLLDEFLRRS